MAACVHASNRVYIPLQDGVYIRSIFLEGAGWDKRNSVLVEPAPMQLVCNMPVIHFRPTEQLKKRSRGNDAGVEIIREKLFATFKKKKEAFTILRLCNKKKKGSYLVRFFGRE